MHFSLVKFLEDAIVLYLACNIDLFYEEFFLRVGIFDDNEGRQEFVFVEAQLLKTRVKAFKGGSVVTHLLLKQTQI